ncbi:hypothetical protein C1H46_031218 [Malus baccata]|uniref:Uncharacterized protein n=1 Tax=Malus baccata TaxID=106549 RepID=A0A540L9P6_MALBA|nr:hypothetical protein C1H46_031218 [Malus baccata]
MVEGLQPFHPKPMEEAAKLMCLEGKRPQLSKTCLSFLGTSIICLSSKGIRGGSLSSFGKRIEKRAWA